MKDKLIILLMIITSLGITTCKKESKTYYVSLTATGNKFYNVTFFGIEHKHTIIDKAYQEDKEVKKGETVIARGYPVPTNDSTAYLTISIVKDTKVIVSKTVYAPDSIYLSHKF